MRPQVEGIGEFGLGVAVVMVVEDGMEVEFGAEISMLVPAAAVQVLVQQPGVAQGSLVPGRVSSAGIRWKFASHPSRESS
jgi:hypothetical protein